MMAQPPSMDQANPDAAKLYVWVKSLESKVNILLREVDVLKNDVLKKQGTFRSELSALSEEILEIKRHQEQSGQKMDLVIKELKRTAGAEEVMTIRRYMDLWNPLHFVTQRDVERVVQTMLTSNQDHPQIKSSHIRNEHKVH